MKYLLLVKSNVCQIISNGIPFVYKSTLRLSKAQDSGAALFAIQSQDTQLSRKPHNGQNTSISGTATSTTIASSSSPMRQ